MKEYLPPHDFQRVSHTFITSSLDYSNSSYVASDQSLLCHLQAVENAAAHLLTGKELRDHITPTFQLISGSSLKFYYLFLRVSVVLAQPYLIER